MDERQAQIRERAGLEESRLNVEFIEFLRKWSTPILLIAAAVAVLYAVRGRVKQSNIAEVNRAFSEYEAAAGNRNPNPGSLTRIADEFGGVRSVAALARLRAADVLLNAVATGVQPGAAVNWDGSLASPDDALTDDDAARLLEQAAALYARVVADSQSDPAQLVTCVAGLFGLAAVDESRGRFDDARRSYERIKSLTAGTSFQPHAAVAQARLDSLDALATRPTLLAAAQLPKLPGEAPPPSLTPPAPPAPPVEIGTPAAPDSSPPAAPPTSPPGTPTPGSPAPDPAPAAPPSTPR